MLGGFSSPEHEASWPYDLPTIQFELSARRGWGSNELRVKTVRARIWDGQTNVVEYHKPI